MTDRTIAARYARALFDVAVREADPQAAARDLAGFVALLHSHTTLEQALLSPAVPAPRKQAVVSALIAHDAQFLPAVARLLTLLAERDRFSLLNEILAAYQARMMDHLQIVRAEVTTSVPLPADRRQALEQRLAEATGKQVSIEARVDPSIIGGVVAQIGSTIYDGSVTRQLERIKERLATGA